MNKKSFLIINPGSATLKWALFSEDNLENPLQSESVQSEPIQSEHGALANIESLVRSDVFNFAQVIIIRFVHGGNYFHKATLVNEAVLKILEGLIDLAPLHNQQSFMCASIIFKKLIENSSAKTLRQKPPKLIAVFDTEFFHDLPEVAKTYGLPFALQKKYHIRRYGFHGFAHHAMHKQLVDNFPEAKKIITLQLGSGC
jgi:acetate kinase